MVLLNHKQQLNPAKAPEGGKKSNAKYQRMARQRTRN